MGLSLNRIHVAVLFVSDLDRARTFYRDTLGMSLSNEDPQSAFFQLEGTSLLLLSTAGAQDLLPGQPIAADPPAIASQLVAFVEDVDAAYRELVGQGVEFIREPTDQPWGLRTAHFKDPDGHVWEISQPISQESGQT